MVDPKKYYFIGFDIGGTKTRAILWHRSKVLKELVMPTAQHKAQFQKNILGTVHKMHATDKELAIGIGVAGTVNKNSLLSAPNIPHVRNFNFRKLFPADIPMMVDNDARCFLRHDILTRKDTKTNEVFAFTIGTGFGRAFSENGIVKNIKKFERPELWEKEYQTIRDSKNYDALAEFLSEKMIGFIKSYQPKIIFLGGGMVERKSFYEKIKSYLKKAGVTAILVRSKKSEHSGALGAIFNYFD